MLRDTAQASPSRGSQPLGHTEVTVIATPRRHRACAEPGSALAPLRENGVCSMEPGKVLAGAKAEKSVNQVLRNVYSKTNVPWQDRVLTRDRHLHQGTKGEGSHTRVMLLSDAVVTSHEAHGSQGEISSQMRKDTFMLETFNIS